jgi:type IV pilus assembly protein PilA
MMKQRGFTLIELMIVVAIIGILAAIAIPAYQDYTVRSKVSEAVVGMSAAKVAISEYYQSQGSMPTDVTTAGITTDIGSKYLNSVVYTRTSATVGLLQAKITGNLGGSTTANNTVDLNGTGSNSKVEWDCRPGSTGTAIPTKYLPADCRQ